MVKEDDTYVLHGPAPLQPLPCMSLGKLVYNNFLLHSEKQAMVDAVTKEYITYNTLLQKTIGLAESLQKNGYDQNTIVAVSSENNLQFFIPIIASFYIGAIVSPVNHNYTKQELFHTLNISKPKVIFCSRAVCRKFIDIKNSEVSYIEKIIVIDTDDDIIGAQSLNSFINRSLKGYPASNRFLFTEFDPDKQIALIMCSSGTTGLPKGVTQTHTNLMVRFMHTIDPKYMSPCDPFLGLLPFFHGFGLVTSFFALVLGEKIIVMKKFAEELFLKTIQDFRIPSIMLAPPLIVFLAKSPLVDKYDLSCVKEIMSGAAPLSKETEEAVKQRIGIKTVRQGYGLTEATLAIICTEVDACRNGSSGKVVSYMSVKIRDPETGRSLGPGEIGELCCKGPMVMPGYYGNPEATRNSFTSDGWLLTGDLGYYDKDGYFYIVDRLKELIKYKGFQVAPAELEGILLTHPKIKDVGVVGVPDDEAGELPLAFVVKKDNVHLTEKEVIKFLAEKVSSQKKLRGGVIFLSEIPKNPSGKILRRELRKLIKTHKAKL